MNKKKQDIKQDRKNSFSSLLFPLIVLVMVAAALFIRATVLEKRDNISASLIKYDRDFCSVKMLVSKEKYVYFNVTGKYAWYYCGTIKSILVTPKTPFLADYDSNPLRTPVLCERKLERDGTKIVIVSIIPNYKEVMCGKNGKLKKILP